MKVIFCILCCFGPILISAQQAPNIENGLNEEAEEIPTTFLPPRFLYIGSADLRNYQGQCGVKGPHRSNAREDLDLTIKQEENLQDDENVCENQDKSVEETNITAGSESIDPDAAITSLEWAVPSLSDTVFAEYAGEHNPLANRITFGEVAGPREFPWQVAITLYGRFHCGASLISDSYVLTAAHCVYLYAHVPSLIDLTLGDWDLKSSSDGRSIKAKVSRATVYPGYTRRKLVNDIAVLKLAKPVTITDRIKPVCLPTNDIALEGKEAIVTGWGRNEAKELQTKLQFLRAKVVSNQLCNERWKGLIQPSMICMDSTTGDSCNADSGGPLVAEYPTGSRKYVQVGIVSFGSGSCTDGNLPGVYTRVAHFRDWIYQQMY